MFSIIFFILFDIFLSVIFSKNCGMIDFYYYYTDYLLRVISKNYIYLYLYIYIYYIIYIIIFYETNNIYI